MSENKSGGWNRPAANQPTAKRNAKAPSKVKGVVAGLVTVCALGGLCLWMFSGGDDAPKAKPDKERGKIKEVTPAAAPTNKVASAKRKIEVRYNPDGSFMKYRDGKPMWLHPEHPPCKWGVVTQKIDRAKLQIESRIFETSTDRQIAYIVNSCPGEEFGDGFVTKNFERDFLKSLSVPIVIKPEDGELERELKQAVIEARAEIKALYDKGENIQTIIDDSIRELQEMGAYRAELMKEIDRISNDPKMTEADLEDAQNAVNEMLEKKGLNKIRLPKMFWNRVKRNQRYQQNLEATKQSKERK